MLTKVMAYYEWRKANNTRPDLAFQCHFMHLQHVNCCIIESFLTVAIAKQ